MKESQAIKAVSKKFIEHWKYLLSLEEWDISVRNVKLEDGKLGECGCEPAHKSATINIDVSKHKTIEELLETVRHEFIHLVHAHFESYRNSVTKILAPNVRDATDDIYAIGAEDVVLKIEHLLGKLNVDVHGRIKK